MDASKHLNQPTPDTGAEQTIFIKRPPLDMPLNLADWVAPQKISDWIGEAIQKIDCTREEAAHFARMSSEQRPQVVLAVLVFAYLTQRFGSREIFLACQSDEALKQICGDKAPFPDELDHFRRKNRALLELVLGQILVRTVQEKFLHAGTVPPGLEHSLFTQAIDQLDTARHMSTWEE